MQLLLLMSTKEGGHTPHKTPDHHLHSTLMPFLCSLLASLLTRGHVSIPAHVTIESVPPPKWPMEKMSFSLSTRCHRNLRPSPGSKG